METKIIILTVLTFFSANDLSFAEKEQTNMRQEFSVEDDRCDPFADTGTDPVDRLSDFKIPQKMERKESGDVFERCLTGDPKLLCTAKVLAYVRRSPDKGRLQISDLRRTEQKV